MSDLAKTARLCPECGGDLEGWLHDAIHEVWEVRQIELRNAHTEYHTVHICVGRRNTEWWDIDLAVFERENTPPKVTVISVRKSS